MGYGLATFGLKSTVRKGKKIGRKVNHTVKIGVKQVHRIAPKLDKALGSAEKVAAAGVLVPGLSPYAAGAVAGLGAARMGVQAVDKGASALEKTRKNANKAGAAFR